MPGVFNLTLRTHPPVVTWGSVSGYVPGGDFSVGYTLDEPAITDARLIDFDGVIFPLTIEAGALTAHLPDTVALGQATVEADVLDDVDNATTRTLTLAIQATIIPPVAPTQVATGLPRETPRATPRRRVVRSRSVMRARTTSRAIVGAVQQTIVRPSTTPTVNARIHSTDSVLSVVTRSHQSAHVQVATAVALSTQGTVRRDESQNALLAILLS